MQLCVYYLNRLESIYPVLKLDTTDIQKWIAIVLQISKWTKKAAHMRRWTLVEGAEGLRIRISFCFEVVMFFISN